jgi:glycosyltransferase involved in cell wall biosynthesis
MNLLHVVPYYETAWSYGGVVRAVSGLAREQVRSGHRVVVLTTDTGGASSRLPAGSTPVGGALVVRARNFSNTLRARLNLSTPAGYGRTARRLIEEHGIDLVHCHELRTIENLRVTAAARDFDLPFVLAPHGTLPYGTGRGLLKKTWDRLFANNLLRRFDHVIAVSEQEATEVRALWSRYRIPLGPQQVTVIPNGVHPDQFASLPDRDESRRRWDLGTGPVVVFLGRLADRKGLHLLIPAFADLVGQFPGARLLLVGPDEGMERRLRDLALRRGMESQVIFTGMLDGNAKLMALRAADVFVLPAEGEGFSLAALEAMACGLPLVLTPGCNFPEVASSGAGLVAPRDIASLADALRTLLLDCEQRSSMGRRARELVLERYAWSRIVSRVDSVYQAALARRRSKSEVSHAAD